MSLERVGGSFLDDDDSLEVVTEEGRRAKVSGGGSQPVGCGFYFAAADIHAVGSYDLAPETIIDNIFNGNTIALPDGIGFTVTADGSSPTFTTTEDGTWAIFFSCGFNTDATWVGNVMMSALQISTPAQPTAAFGPLLSFGSVQQIPSGATFKFTIATSHVATDGSYSPSSSTASIVRLA